MPKTAVLAAVVVAAAVVEAAVVIAAAEVEAAVVKAAAVVEAAVVGGAVDGVDPAETAARQAERRRNCMVLLSLLDAGCCY